MEDRTSTAQHKRASQRDERATDPAPLLSSAISHQQLDFALICYLHLLLCCVCFSLPLVLDLFNLRFSASQLSKEAKKSEKSAESNKLKCKKAMEVSVGTANAAACVRAGRVARERRSSLDCCLSLALAVVQQGNMEGARIFAESAIRDKNTALNCQRSARERHIARVHRRADSLTAARFALLLVRFVLSDLRLSSRIDAVAQRVNTAVKMNSLTKDMSGIVKSMDAVMKTMNVEKITSVMDKFEAQFENLDLTTGVMEGSMLSSTAQAMPESQVESLMQQVADEHGLEIGGALNALPSGVNRLGQRVEAPVSDASKPVLLAGGGARKPGDDAQQPPPAGGAAGGASAGGGGFGAAASSSSGGAGGGIDEESLEDRLRRLQQ